MIPTEVFLETLWGFLAPVRRYLDDPSVSEILINGPDQIYIERGGRLELTPVRFQSREAVLCALRNAAQFVGKRVDESSPILEARLPDGSRLEAVIPPAAPDGPCMTIRRFLRDNFTVAGLTATGTFTEEAADTLDALVKAKLNLIVAGGTGCGKTSMLNLLSGFIPAGERTVVIEDSKEVEIQHPHVVYLEARPPDPHGRGEVTIRELFRASLRLRPDRIVIGEIRGGEALDIVQAMVSGHGGCLATLHATYPRDTLTRLETMGLMSDVNLPLVALRLQIASGLNVIVQMARLRDGSRKITHITEIVGFDLSQGKYQLCDLFERQYSGTDDSGRIRSELVPTGALPTFLPQLRAQGVDLPGALYEAARARPSAA